MSITAGNRLAFLSGLSGVPAYQHLRQIAGFYGVAAAMLVAFSGYPTAPAWVHLFPPETTETENGGASAKYRESASDEFEWTSTKRKRVIDETLATAPGLTDTDRGVIAASLNAFLAAGQPEDSEAGRAAIREFLDSTIARLERADLVRQAATEQIAQDFQDAATALRLNNNRRAIMLVVLLMLYN
jgi:hypothetical protein